MTATVQGFLRRDGQHLVNDAGEVLLKGWGIGNWLVPEGYMWESQGAKNFDRPRRIKARVEELLGPQKAAAFWPAYRAVFFTKADVGYIKSQGYNSIRLPFDASLLLEDGPGVHFKESGFHYLEEAARWCQQADLYLIFDMHAAPGGQTGANIDNAVEEIPRLFIDQAQYDKGVALWQEIARRFHNDPYVGGYDLLNEPIRPGGGALTDYDYLLPRLSAFYADTIKAIRSVDPAHLVSLEGHHWASSPLVFTHRYDENMVIHFHRYGGFPEKAQFTQWLDLRKQLNVPLWLGETGENKPQWYSAVTQFCTEADIGFCFWPYKKMGRQNGAVTVKTPASWDEIIRYVQGGPHPGYAQANQLFQQLLKNMDLSQCQKNADVDRQILRQAGMTLRATDYRDADCIGNEAAKNFEGYRAETPMQVAAYTSKQASLFAFDSHWDRFELVLQAGEAVTYLAPAHAGTWRLKLAVRAAEQSALEISIAGQQQRVAVNAGGEVSVRLPANVQDAKLTVHAVSGSIRLTALAF